MNAIFLRILVVLMGSAALVTACKVDDPDHCANQDQSPNAWCASRFNSKPYCSPCVESRENNGCVQFEPFACDGYEGDAVYDDAEAY